MKLNLKKLRSIIEDVIKLGKEAYGMNDLHCYSFEPVKKWCSLSVFLTGITIGMGFGEKKVYQSGEMKKTIKIIYTSNPEFFRVILCRSFSLRSGLMSLLRL